MTRASGLYATWRGAEWPAKAQPDGRVNLVVEGPVCPDGFEASYPPGVWHRYARPDELSALSDIQVWACWRDHELFVLGGPANGCAYLAWNGRNGEWGAGRLTCREPGRWEGNVPFGEIDSIREEREDAMPRMTAKYRAKHDGTTA